MQINFISHKNSEETRTMYTKSRNIEIMKGNERDELIICFKRKKLQILLFFESLLQNYQKKLEESIRVSEFFLDSIDLLYYHLQKTSLNRKGSPYIDSPK